MLAPGNEASPLVTLSEAAGFPTGDAEPAGFAAVRDRLLFFSGGKLWALLLGRASFLRGDCNADGVVETSDAVFTLGSLFLGDRHPTCDDACDSNDDGRVDISDAVATLGVLFLGQGPIPLPGVNDCGVDPTEDELSCTETSCP